jgi:hypothetical protein
MQNPTQITKTENHETRLIRKEGRIVPTNLYSLHLEIPEIHILKTI